MWLLDANMDVHLVQTLGELNVSSYTAANRGSGPHGLVKIYAHGELSLQPIVTLAHCCNDSYGTYSSLISYSTIRCSRRNCSNGRRGWVRIRAKYRGLCFGFTIETSHTGPHGIDQKSLDAFHHRTGAGSYRRLSHAFLGRGILLRTNYPVWRQSSSPTRPSRRWC